MLMLIGNTTVCADGNLRTLSVRLDSIPVILLNHTVTYAYLLNSRATPCYGERYLPGLSHPEGFHSHRERMVRKLQ